MGNKLQHPELELPPEKLAIVTGGNDGIGYETAKSLGKMGATVLIACRSEEKANAAIERMQTEHREETLHKESATQDDVEIQPLKVDFLKIDLSSLQSTMEFIYTVKQTTSSLNILVCNAGIAFVKQCYTDDGFESHFQVNYLSHLLVILHLLPLLRAGAPDSRIILLSSGIHDRGVLDLDNMQGRKSYSVVTSYASSKAYMIMAAHFLARRLMDCGVYTYAVNPGAVNTDILSKASDSVLLKFLAGAASFLHLMRTPKKGAATSVVACVDPALEGRTAVFLRNCQPASHNNNCRDESKQEALWTYSLECLNKHLTDSILEEAFPTANPSLLGIPLPLRTAEEDGRRSTDPDITTGGQPQKPQVPQLTSVTLEVPSTTPGEGPLSDSKEESLEGEGAAGSQVDREIPSENPETSVPLGFPSLNEAEPDDVQQIPAEALPEAKDDSRMTSGDLSEYNVENTAPDVSSEAAESPSSALNQNETLRGLEAEGALERSHGTPGDAIKQRADDGSGEPMLSEDSEPLQENRTPDVGEELATSQKALVETYNGHHPSQDHEDDAEEELAEQLTRDEENTESNNLVASTQEDDNSEAVSTANVTTDTYDYERNGEDSQTTDEVDVVVDILHEQDDTRETTEEAIRDREADRREEEGPLSLEEQVADVSPIDDADREPEDAASQGETHTGFEEGDVLVGQDETAVGEGHPGVVAEESTQDTDNSFRGFNLILDEDHVDL